MRFRMMARRRIGLQACYRKTLNLQGVPIFGDQASCITGAQRTSDEGRDSRVGMTAIPLFMRNRRGELADRGRSDRRLLAGELPAPLRTARAVRHVQTRAPVLPEGGTAGCVLAARLSENADRAFACSRRGPTYGRADEGGWPRASATASSALSVRPSSQAAANVTSSSCVWIMASVPSFMSASQ